MLPQFHARRDAEQEHRKGFERQQLDEQLRRQPIIQRRLGFERPSHHPNMRTRSVNFFFPPVGISRQWRDSHRCELYRGMTI